MRGVLIFVTCVKTCYPQILPPVRSVGSAGRAPKARMLRVSDIARIMLDGMSEVNAFKINNLAYAASGADGPPARRCARRLLPRVTLSNFCK